MRNISQLKTLQKSNKYFILLISFIFLTLSACDAPAEQKDSSTTTDKPTALEGYGHLKGDEKALSMVEDLLAALGGREKWQDLKFLYYKEKVDKKGIDTTYTIETWINLEEFDLKTEQKGTKFHTFLSVGNEGGKAHDLIKKRFVDIRPYDIPRFKHKYTHNMYRLIKQLAVGDSLFVRMRNANRFDIMNKDTLLGGFNLDPKNIPEFFGAQIYQKGKTEQITHFTGWKEEDGFIFPLDGETTDRNMTFIMDTWKAYTQPLDVVFPNLDSLKTK